MKNNTFLLSRMILLLAGAFFLLIPVKTLKAATTYTVSPDDGVYTINDYLEGGTKDNPVTVKLEAGKTYDLSWPPIIARSYSTLDASGATIIGDNHNAVISPCDTDCGETDYKLTNFKIKGGTWKNTSKTGYEKSVIKIAFANGVVLDGLNMAYANYQGHSIEIMASKNVTVKNCTIKALGTPKANSVEEQIQIDIAAHAANAPFLPAKLLNGATCHNIKILNNTVTGCRAVCANYTTRAAKYKGNCHTNITIQGNKLIGKTAEALALFNTTSATVKNNTCISYGKKSVSKTLAKKSDSYFSGCLIRIQNKVTNGEKMAKRTITVTGNTFKGEQFGLRFGSGGGKAFKKITVSKNKCYSSKKKKDNALKCDSVIKKAYKQSKNTYYKQAVSKFGSTKGRKKIK